MKIKKLNENAVIPTYGTEYSAGADLYACTDEDITINPGETKLIKTGIAIEIPVGYAGFIYVELIVVSIISSGISRCMK